MKVIWKSYQGKDRKCNNDYGVFCNYSNCYVFIIGDAKEEIESQNFIKYILEVIAKELYSENRNILSILQHAKESYAREVGMPNKLPNQMASLHILIVNKENFQTQSFNLGDCRFGHKTNNEWKWLTEPHVISGLEHYVTQSFRTKKSIGEICKQEFILGKTESYCLGSDGYWKENMNQSDDHSQLLILELDVETLETSDTTINFSIF